MVRSGIIAGRKMAVGDVGRGVFERPIGPWLTENAGRRIVGRLFFHFIFQTSEHIYSERTNEDMIDPNQKLANLAGDQKPLYLAP